MENHKEKQEIFGQYAKQQGFESWDNLILSSINNRGITPDIAIQILRDHTFAACDLVQAEQQKRIAENANIKHTEDGTTGYSRAIGNDREIFSINIASIINPENLIK